MRCTPARLICLHLLAASHIWLVECSSGGDDFCYQQAAEAPGAKPSAAMRVAPGQEEEENGSTSGGAAEERRAEDATPAASCDARAMLEATERGDAEAVRSCAAHWKHKRGNIRQHIEELEKLRQRVGKLTQRLGMAALPGRGARGAKTLADGPVADAGEAKRLDETISVFRPDGAFGWLEGTAHE